MLDAIEETATFTRKRILDIRDLMTETMEVAKETLPGRVYSKELIELLFCQPYTKGQSLVDAGIAKRKTAAEYLKDLEKTGIQNMDTLFRYVHSMDMFTKEYSCIHQIPWGQIKNVSIKPQFMDTLQGRVHDVDMFLQDIKSILKDKFKSQGIFEKFLQPVFLGWWTGLFL
jgi:hypothetical protein